MATHSSILAWRIPWTEEPEGLLSIGSQSQTQLRNLAHMHAMLQRDCLVVLQSQFTDEKSGVWRNELICSRIMEESRVILSGSQAAPFAVSLLLPLSESMWRLQSYRQDMDLFLFFRIYFLKACLSEFYELKFELCSEVLLLVFQKCSTQVELSSPLPWHLYDGYYWHWKMFHG